MKNNICLFAGTFDPFTIGHEEIVERALNDYEKVVIGVFVNKDKTPLFSLEDRLNFINTIYKNNKNVIVKSSNGYTVDFMKEHNIIYTIRGVRNEVDNIYEHQMEDFNKSLMPEIKTVYYTASKKYEHVSSTFVKELIKTNQDYSAYVNEKVLTVMQKALLKQGK